MKVLLVNGSPHKKGCTYTALCAVSEALNLNGIGTDVFWAGDGPVGGCAACPGCRAESRCALRSAADEFLEIAGDYDGFVFGAPARESGAFAAAFPLLDRAFYADRSSGGRRFRLKPAAAVMAARRAGDTAAWAGMNRCFSLMQMPIITAGWENTVHGATPQAVRQDGEGMRTMRVLGHNMAYFLKCKEVGAKLGIPEPPLEPPARGDFFRERADENEGEGYEAQNRF